MHAEPVTLAPELVAQACRDYLLAHQRNLDFAFRCWQSTRAGTRSWRFGRRLTPAELEARWRHPETADGLHDHLRRHNLALWRVRWLLGHAEAGATLSLSAADHGLIADYLPQAGTAAQEAVLNLSQRMLPVARDQAGRQGLSLQEHPGRHSTYVIAKGHPEAVDAFLAACRGGTAGYILCAVRDVLPALA